MAWVENEIVRDTNGGLVILAGGDALGVGAVDLNGRRAAANYTASGDWSFCAGGECEASGDYSVAIGSDCHSTEFAAVALGDHCVASDDASVALGKGSNAVAKGAIAVGLDAYAHLDGQFAHCSGAGTFAHTPQFTRQIMQCYTTDANFTEVVSPGRLILDWRVAVDNPQAAFGVRVTAVGRTPTAGEAVFLIRQALIEKVATTVAMIGAVGTIGTDIIAGALTGADLQLTADDTNKSLKIEVKGAAGKNVLWGVSIEAYEVAFPA